MYGAVRPRSGRPVSRAVLPIAQGLRYKNAMRKGALAAAAAATIAIAWLRAGARRVTPPAARRPMRRRSSTSTTGRTTSPKTRSQNFENETGIKVRYDNFDNNEIVQAKLVAGKTGYDVVVPSCVLPRAADRRRAAAQARQGASCPTSRTSTRRCRRAARARSGQRATWSTGCGAPRWHQRRQGQGRWAIMPMPDIDPGTWSSSPSDLASSRAAACPSSTPRPRWSRPRCTTWARPRSARTRPTSRRGGERC